MSTYIIILKAICVFIEGVCLALVAGLAQWITEGQVPGWIAWIVIACSSIANGFSKLGNYLSTSFSKYLEARNGNGNNHSTGLENK